MTSFTISLFTAPLPLKEREEHGFRGPRENTPRLDTVQYYKNCKIRDRKSVV